MPDRTAQNMRVHRDRAHGIQRSPAMMGDAALATRLRDARRTPMRRPAVPTASAPPLVTPDAMAACWDQVCHACLSQTPPRMRSIAPPDAAACPECGQRSPDYDLLAEIALIVDEMERFDVLDAAVWLLEP